MMMSRSAIPTAPLKSHASTIYSELSVHIATMQSPPLPRTQDGRAMQCIYMHMIITIEPKLKLYPKPLQDPAHPA